MPDDQALRDRARRAVHDAASAHATRDGLHTVQRRTQRVLEAQLALVRRSHKPLACTRGCAMCCHLRVMATPAEIFGLVRYMRAHLDPHAFEAVASDIAAAATRIHALPRERVLSTNIACPLLVDGACSMYPARPFNCRAYHSLDRGACLASFENPDDPTLSHPQSAQVARVNEGVQQGFIDVIAGRGLDTCQYELVTALDEAIREPDAERRFESGEPAFGVALRM